MVDHRYPNVGVAPGAGLLWCTDRALVFFPVGAGDGVARRLSTLDGGDVTDVLADLLVDDTAHAPPFVSVEWRSVPSGDECLVRVRGDVEVVGDLPSMPTPNAGGSDTWVEHRVSLDPDGARFRCGGAAVVGTALRSGLVPAGGFDLVLGGARAVGESLVDGIARLDGSGVADWMEESLQLHSRADESSRSAPPPDAGTRDPMVAGAHHEVTLTEPPVVEGGPLVTARLCVDGHPNPPAAMRCRTCRGTVDRDASTIDVDQPTLATIGLPDGSVHPLGRSVVLGRRPDPEAARAADSDVVSLDAPATVSRTHLRVHADGWRLFATDCSSTGGTALVTDRDVDGEPCRLEPWVAHEIGPGDRLFLGSATTTIVIRDPQEMHTP